MPVTEVLVGNVEGKRI